MRAMGEILYDLDSAAIAGALFVSMAVVIELGHRLGRRRAPRTDPAAREHINGIQAAILGVLALLLGFTFSLSLQRFDSRSAAVVEEANAIGTAWLRSALLAPALQAEAVPLFVRYVELRVREGSLTLAEEGERHKILADSMQVQSALWATARKALAAEPQAEAPALYAEAVNQMIDGFGRRDATLKRHVPEVVLMLLYATFLLAGIIVGYACGVGGHRPSLASYAMVALIVVLVYLIVDLDRPRRGVIRVSQQSLVELQAAVRGQTPTADGRR